MENSVTNCARKRVFSNHQIRTIHEEEDQEEESSWIVYFEDIDHDEEMSETKEDMSHFYDNDSSLISDAASPPIHTTHIHNVVHRKSNNININPKKRRINHQHKEEQKGDEEEEEDTASSPSNKTKGFSVLDVTGNNMRHGKSMDIIASKESGCIMDKASELYEEFSEELKKRGLCVVPLSILSNFIA